MTGVCGRESDKQVIWELVRRESGAVLTFYAEAEGASIADYGYENSELLPPWAEYAKEITEIHLDGNIEVLGRQCFRGMDHLQKIYFLADGQQESHLRVIGAQAFQDCRRLTEIEIPDSVVTIESKAFEAAEQLKRVHIGTGLKKLGAGAFAQNVSLEELCIESSQLEEAGKKLFALNHRLSVCSCPEGGVGAVELKNQFEKIYTRGGEEDSLVVDRAVSAKAAAKPGEDMQADGSIRGTLTDTVKYCLRPLGEEDYCLEISGTGAMPEWVSRENQPWRAQAGKITEVRVEEGVTTIGGFAFSGLTRLSKVQLPGTVRTIGIVSMGECSSLTELRFPEGFEALGCRSLWACPSLKTLWLPKTFKVADLMATAYSPGIEEIYFAGSEAQWKKDVIIDNMMERNHVLLEAKMHFGEENDDSAYPEENTAAHSREYLKELGKIAGLLKAKGDGKLHVVALNLGDSFLISKIGDSTLIIFPEGSTMLIDTGSCGARKHLISFLRTVGLDHLDYLVFTHPHGDHFGGALELIKYLWDEKKGSIGEVWYSEAAVDSPAVRPAMQALKAKGVPLRRPMVEEDPSGERPAKITIDGVELSIYGPNEDDIEAVRLGVKVESANNVSAVLRFAYGETVFITAGDIYREKERYLINTYGAETFKADVIKMNHHGNFQGSTPEWINATQPQIAYAETDGNGSSDVMRRFTEAGTVCYSTGLDGMLHLTMGREKDITIFHEFDSMLRE